MTTTKKQIYCKKISDTLELTGLSVKDRNKLALHINNGAIHDLEDKKISSGLFKQNKINAALRRTFGRNVVVYGPEGYVVVEGHEIISVYEYDRPGQFQEMTSNFLNFTIFETQNELLSLTTEP